LRPQKRRVRKKKPRGSFEERQNSCRSKLNFTSGKRGGTEDRMILMQGETGFFENAMAWTGVQGGEDRSQGREEKKATDLASRRGEIPGEAS